MTSARAENSPEDIGKLEIDVVNSNIEFIRCDKFECSERGQYPRCYFDIYLNCEKYTEKNY